MTDVRIGQDLGHLARHEFGERFRHSFVDPAFQVEGEASARLDDLSVDWIATRTALDTARKVWVDAATATRVLVICAWPRDDGTCPGEISTIWRLSKMVAEVMAEQPFDVDFVDLSLITSGYGRHIHPCKACVSTAMPLCHRPCSGYPNHSLNQNNDWMAEICERWVSAHAIVIMTPVHWYQSPSVLKLMVDRLVCTDGGNPDPTSTHGKKPEEAKALEWKAGTTRSTSTRARCATSRKPLSARSPRFATAN